MLSLCRDSEKFEYFVITPTCRAISLEEAAKSQKLLPQKTLPLLKENLATLTRQWSPSGSTQSLPCTAECSLEPAINALAIRPPSAALRSETSSRRTSEASSVFEFPYDMMCIVRY